jgi:hypothetical protein
MMGEKFIKTSSFLTLDSRSIIQVGIQFSKVEHFSLLSKANSQTLKTVSNSIIRKVSLRRNEEAKAEIIQGL